MNKETPEFLAFEYKDRVFSYRCLPFGIPKGPGAFQRCNMVAVNYLRNFGVSIILYLDDRLIIDPPGNGPPRNAILSMLIITAAGGMISLAKSNLEGSTKERFLGMELSTPTCEISVPEDKWLKFRDLANTILESEIIPLKDLERLRGKAISFILAIPLAKLYIRRMTEKITIANRTAELEVHNDARLREEIQKWLEFDLSELKSCWNKELHPSQTKITSFADASSFAGGIVIMDRKLGAATCYQFSEDMARKSIAHKEADAILRMLRTFRIQLSNKYIIHFCDNQVIIAS